MGADFTPSMEGYKQTGSFKFWCNKVLPLVYDDSLSYYEVLCKVVKYLNDVIYNVDGLHTDVTRLRDAYVQLQTYVNTYFDNLDVQNEINEKLDVMAEDGTLSALIGPFVSEEIGGVVAEQIGSTVASQIGGIVAEQIGDAVAEQIAEPTAEAVTNWLNANVDPVGSAVVVDKTLTIEGAAADADVTGFKLQALKNALDTGDLPIYNTWNVGEIVSHGSTNPYTIDSTNTSRLYLVGTLGEPVYGLATSGYAFLLMEIDASTNAVVWTDTEWRSENAWGPGKYGVMIRKNDGTDISAEDGNELLQISTRPMRVNPISLEGTIAEYGYPADAKSTSDAIGELKSALFYSEEFGIEHLTSYSQFERGTLNNGANTNANYRIRSVEIITAPRDLTINIESGYRAGFHYFVGGTYSDHSGWKTGEFLIPKNTSFRVTIGKTPEDTSVTADVDTYSKALTFKTIYSEKIAENTSDIEDLQFSQASVLVNGYEVFDDSLFSRGAIKNNDGTITSFTSRAINVSFLRIDRNKRCYIKAGYRIALFTYTDNGTYIGTSGWKYDYVDIPKDTNFRIQISATPEDTSVTADISLYVSQAYLDTYIYSNISVLLKNSVGDGNLTYVGDKINLSTSNASRKCNISTFVDLHDGDIPNLADYHLHLNQSMSIFGGYIFLFSHGGEWTVMDFETKEIIDAGTLETTLRNHTNSAQFTDIYYNDGDDFPLMLLSRCGSAASGTGDEECLVYRITKSDSDFTFTLVNKIFAPFNTYGASYGIDNNTSLLYMVAYLNDHWTTSENNPLYVFVFDMPSKTDILSGTEITLPLSSIKCKAEYAHTILQGNCVDGGLVYSGITDNGQNIWTFDPWRNRIKSKIKLTSPKEVEGVAIYDGKLYCTQKDGSDSSAINPFQIFALSFDS